MLLYVAVRGFSTVGIPHRGALVRSTARERANRDSEREPEKRAPTARFAPLFFFSLFLLFLSSLFSLVISLFLLTLFLSVSCTRSLLNVYLTCRPLCSISGLEQAAGGEALLRSFVAETVLPLLAAAKKSRRSSSTCQSTIQKFVRKGLHFHWHRKAPLKALAQCTERQLDRVGSVLSSMSNEIAELRQDLGLPENVKAFISLEV